MFIIKGAYYCLHIGKFVKKFKKIKNWKKRINVDMINNNDCNIEQ